MIYGKISTPQTSSSNMQAETFQFKTEKAYLTWIRRFILFNIKRHPREMGEKEISKYLTFLADKANVSALPRTKLSVLFYYYMGDGFFKFL